MRLDFPHLYIEISAEVDFCFHALGDNIAEDPHLIAEPQQAHTCRPSDFSFFLLVVVQTHSVEVRRDGGYSAFECEFRIGYGIHKILFDVAGEGCANINFFLHFGSFSYTDLVRIGIYACDFKESSLRPFGEQFELYYSYDFTSHNRFCFLGFEKRSEDSRAGCERLASISFLCEEELIVGRFFFVRK